MERNSIQVQPRLKVPKTPSQSMAVVVAQYCHLTYKGSLNRKIMV
jgi:hypothetical protein